MANRVVELIKSRTYHRGRYPSNNNPATGWVVLVDGQPHYFSGRTAKKEAREWMGRFTTTNEAKDNG
jgi:hypothetical protein